MLFEIKHRYTGAILASHDLTSLRDALEASVKGGANMGGADLRGADLRGANLGGANLGGADLGDLGKLVGRGMLQIGPIGSRNDYLIVFYTETGIHIRAGCFFGTLAAFVAAVAETHGDNKHARHYRAAVALIEACAPVAA